MCFHFYQIRWHSKTDLPKESKYYTQVFVSKNIIIWKIFVAKNIYITVGIKEMSTIQDTTDYLAKTDFSPLPNRRRCHM